MQQQSVQIQSGEHILEGILTIPEGATGIVLFAHGSGSSRLSPRNQFVATEINKAGVATLLFDLLTAEEESVDIYTREFRFNITLLAERLIGATHWISKEPLTKDLKIGYFGSSTGAAAALMAAAPLKNIISAVVSRGGRPDLAGNALPEVTAPTLLIVGGLDDVVIGLNKEASSQLTCPKEMVIIPGATHLFEEPGTLEEVAKTAANFFAEQLKA